VSSRLEFTHGGHRYKLDGRPVKSVTTLLQVLAKPQLVAWAANESADYAIDHWEHLAEQTPSERRTLIAGAHRRRRDKAAARGTQIHEWAEALTAGEAVDIPAEHIQTVGAFARWWEGAGFTKVWSEAAVYCEEDPDLGMVAYAGRFDMLAEHPRWGVTLLDWKTGKGVYSEFAVQLAAYAGAEMIQVPEGEALVDRAMPAVHTLAVVHIQPDGPTLHTLDRTQRGLAAERWELVRLLNTNTEPEWSQQA
jgi:hypothetical protein